MESRGNQEEHVRRYLEAQLRLEAPDGVDHAELLKEEFIRGERYEVWDCRTHESGRWWVVAPFMNLYSQEDFKSADYLLSFHIGLTFRVMARSDPAASEEELDEFTEVWRRWQQAADLLDEAEEAEDFQGVGMRLREAMVSLAHHVADEKPHLHTGADPAPKRSDFVGWADSIANTVAAGQSAKRLRTYLKDVAADGWAYVNWLTHAKKATRADADQGARITEHVLIMFGLEMIPEFRKPQESCPACGSYILVSESDWEGDELLKTTTCHTCGWLSEPALVRRLDDDLATKDAAEVVNESECTPSSDGRGSYDSTPNRRFKQR